MATYRIEWYREKLKRGTLVVDATSPENAIRLANSVLKYERPESFKWYDAEENLPTIDTDVLWLRWAKLEKGGVEKIYSKEIAKEIRKHLKAVFGKGWKFSVVRDSGGSYTASITVSIMQAPVEIRTVEDAYMQLNHYYPENETRLTESGRAVFNLVTAIARYRHWDKSDPMVDYFNTNYYLHVQLGKWDRDFTVVSESK